MVNLGGGKGNFPLFICKFSLRTSVVKSCKICFFDAPKTTVISRKSTSLKLLDISYFVLRCILMNFPQLIDTFFCCDIIKLTALRLISKSVKILLFQG